MRHYLRTAAWMVPCVAMVVAPAFADVVRLTVRETENGPQIEARWADGREGEPPRIEASVEAGVLRLRFAEAVEVDPSNLASEAPRIVSFAQAEEGGRDVRIALRSELEPHVARAGSARVVQLGEPGAPARLQPAQDEPPPPPPAAPSNVATVSVGNRDDFTRLAFRWPDVTTVQPRQTGERLELHFSRAADLDISELRSSLPRYVRNVQIISRPGQPVRLALTLEPGVRQRHFVDGQYTVIDLVRSNEPVASTPQQAAEQQTAPPPLEENFTAPRAPSAFRIVEEDAATRITFEFPTPTRAAAFRRGENIWILLESGGRVDLRNTARANRRHTDLIAIANDGMIGLRIPAPPEVMVSARSEGNSWTFTLSSRAQTGAQSVNVRRDMSVENMGRLVADFDRRGTVKWLQDPSLGDRIGIALVGGPARGIAQRRATLEAALLPTAQGALIETRADGVTAAFDRGDLVVSRGDGLIATSAAQESETLDAPDVAAIESLEANPPSANIRERLDELSRAAAAEGVEEGASVEARLALARFLVENELAAEALGALRIVLINQPEMEIDPEFRLLRASANIMMGRSADARADLAASSLTDSKPAAMWRGYAAAMEENWDEARTQFDKGMDALESFQPEWRARFHLARAEAALQAGDLVTAEAAARDGQSQAASAAARLRASLLLARAIGAKGDKDAALAIFTELTRARDEEVAVRAGLEAVRLRRASGTIPVAEAVEMLEAMRFRWRGDALEIDVIAALGDAYMELSRWREALEVMQVAADRYPENPAARRLRADMTQAFERLFLDGEADKLEPIQALALFYQFVDLTPAGPNGDRIVRLLAARLVKVDLLEQAAQLLQHQVDERLEGVARAQVAGDLAAIYLMDRKPEQAFQTINLTRTSNIPPNVLAERRIIEARALIDMGRLDHAIELVERDQSADAQRIRAEAAWRARDWERASAELRRLLSLRSRGAPLDEDGRLIVLRTAIAMTMAGQDDQLRVLYRDYAGDMAGSDQADAFEVVAAGVNAEGVAVRDLARAVSRSDLLERFLQRIKTRLSEGEAAPAQTPQQQRRPAA